MFYKVKHVNKETQINIEKIASEDGITKLRKIKSGTFNVVFASPPFKNEDRYSPFKEDSSDDEFKRHLDWSKEWLTECIRVLKPTGTLLVHSIPKWLPYYGVFLNEKKMKFKYWIALENLKESINDPIIPAHEGILLYVKNQNKFVLNIARAPHKRCRLCNDFLADWGGKKEQMHPNGYVISDIWKDINVKQWSFKLPKEVIERVIELTCRYGYSVLFALFDDEIPLEKVSESGNNRV